MLMAKLYFNKIKRRETNFMTGETWAIEDVPVLWRTQVQEMLNEDEHGE